MGIIQNMEQYICSQTEAALKKAKEKEEISFEEIPKYTIEVPKDKAHGDFALNIAMVMAKQAHMAPQKIAEAIINNLDLTDSQVEKVEIAGAGFLNFYLNKVWLCQVIAAVLKEGEKYGSVNIGNGKRVQVEFISANPTGLLHMGNARGGAIGDSLGNILSFAGYDVEKEYYINDAGNQMRLFGISVEARYLELLGEAVDFPEDGYHGEDIIATAKHYLDEFGDNLKDTPSEERQAILGDYALKEKLSSIKNVLSRYGIEFDNWFSERSLYSSGKLKETIEELIAKGYAYEKDGAIILKAAHQPTTEVKAGEHQNLEEKEDVLVRSNGLPTYFAADIAYHRDKFNRGFDKLINIWGADHHGHVARIKRTAAMFGNDPENLTILLMQLVRLIRNGEPVRMSKRSGTYLTLEELLDEVGYDAARYFFVMRNPNSDMDFDLELAKSKTSDNPVFYVQYAHARICSILRQAEALGYTVPKNGENLDLTVLNSDEELALIKKIADLPGEITISANLLEPHRLTTYLQELAQLFHSFYNQCRVNVEEENIRNPRLALCLAAKIAIKNVLSLLGVSAPEEM